MDIHEHQAKQVLSKFGVPVPTGFVAFSAEGAVQSAQKLFEHSPIVVLKAQIHAGGRGKAGGVKICKTLSSLQAEAEKMMGSTLVTHQTGPAGKVVRRLYVEAGSKIQKEYYLSAVVDRTTETVMFMASSEGGMDIEEVAKNSPEKIVKIGALIATGVQNFHSRVIAAGIGLSANEVPEFSKFMTGIYNTVVSTDASQVEINPMIRTEDGKFLALDAKINFDDNALFRHKDILDMQDLSEEDPSEVAALSYGLSYIKLNGSIGCMVNGAGLAMATMDIIKHYGGEPANFLDVGGGATKDKVIQAFKIILSDPSVKAILVNIFGGIMKCDIIAEGVIAAARELGVKVPLVVRLEGTNVELGKKLLSESELDIIPADNLEDAAQKVASAVKNA